MVAGQSSMFSMQNRSRRHLGRARERTVKEGGIVDLWLFNSVYVCWEVGAQSRFKMQCEKHIPMASKVPLIGSQRLHENRWLRLNLRYSEEEQWYMTLPSLEVGRDSLQRPACPLLPTSSHITTLQTATERMIVQHPQQQYLV